MKDVVVAFAVINSFGWIFYSGYLSWRFEKKDENGLPAFVALMGGISNILLIWAVTK